MSIRKFKKFHRSQLIFVLDILDILFNIYNKKMVSIGDLSTNPTAASWFLLWTL